MGSKTKTYKPSSDTLFGLDIGNGSLKVMQLTVPTRHYKKAAQNYPHVVGYGSVSFDPKAITTSGVIRDPEIIAKAAHSLVSHDLTGRISSKNVAMALPSYRTIMRTIRLPATKPKRVAAEAAKAFSERTRLPLDRLYLQQHVIYSDKQQVDVLVVAAPKPLVDSYRQLAAILGLRLVLIESAMTAAGHLFSYDRHSNVPSLLIDFGSLSADIAIYDNGVQTTTTIKAGGQVFTNLIRQKLNVTPAEAHLIKSRYGLGASKKQKMILQALEPTLELLVSAIRRAQHTYAEQNGGQYQLKQVITIGGGAAMPGLSDYLTDSLRLAVRHADLTTYCNFSTLPAPNHADRASYLTAAGLSMRTR